MNLLTKKISGLSPDELNELFKAVGTSGLPYPASHFVTDAAGKLQMEVGIIADDAHPLVAYSNRSHDYVVGQLYRRMAIPSLLHVQKEALLRRAPESNSRVMLILGKPGTGKSEGAKTIADACDERGADVVDCGGRYLGDLLWEQTIDYGEDFKTALTERIRSGLLSAASVKVFEEQFSDALVKDADGKITDIDWNKTAASKKDESAEAALKRSVEFAKTVAEFESIPTQTVNSVGIKKIPGVIKRWHEEGRTGILDEYTKSVEGSDDSLQTVLQYLNGEIDEVTVTNTMKVSGREETYSYTLKRSEMKTGFFVYMTGNDQEDGVSTHMLSKSAYSRLPVFKIEDPLPVDWKHRISQVLTGLPLSTVYSVFSDTAKDDTKEFAQMMIELRLMGLSADQQARVPSHHLTMLNNWEQTNAAIEKLANFYMYWAKIIDPKSELYDPEKAQNQTNIDNIMPEISASYRDESAIDFRKVIQDMAEALKVKPSVKKIEGGSSLRLNFSEVGRKKTAAVDKPEVISAEFGTRLEAVLLERIGTMTQGRPNLQEALIKEARERGVLTIDPTIEQETVGKLLNQDMYTEVGGIKTIVTLRDALVARLKQANPDLNGKSDEEVMPMDKAVEACTELAGLASETANNSTPRAGRLIVLGKDVSHIFNRVSAVDGIGRKEKKPEPTELVATSDFLESLKIPAVANMNMKGIWRTTITAEKLLKSVKDILPIVQIAEGKSASKIGLTTVMMQGANDNSSVPVHIMVDETRKKGLIVTDAVDAKTKAALGNDFTIVTYDDVNAETQVAAFIRETLQHPTRKATLAELERQLVRAFTLRAGNESEPLPLAQMMTTRALPAEAPVYMINQPV